MSSGEYDSKQKVQSKMQPTGVRHNHLKADQKIPDAELDDFELDETDQPQK